MSDFIRECVIIVCACLCIRVYHVVCMYVLSGSNCVCGGWYMLSGSREGWRERDRERQREREREREITNEGCIIQSRL